MRRKRKQYPTELKDAIAQRYLTTDISYRELAREVGADKASVYAWVDNFKEHGMADLQRGKKAKTTEGRSPEEKLRLVIEAKGLSEEDRGAFLRSEGIHDEDLLRWEEAALGALTAKRASQDRRIRELERQTKKQEKRLREATALLDLQKKVQALWGGEEDDTEPSND